MFDFKNKEVLITGASGAIGKAMSIGFADAGANLSLHYFSNEKKANELLEMIDKRGHWEHQVNNIFHGDLRKKEDADMMVESVLKRSKKIDVLVNCMGKSCDNSIFFLSKEELREVFQSNLTTLFYVCQAVAPIMINQKGGKIVNVSSITGTVGQPMRTIYAASKSAVIAFTKSIAKELAAHGINVNCVAPQVVEGGMSKTMKRNIQEILIENTPINRTCYPEDIAGTALFLASPLSSFIVGETISVTGGLVTW